MEWMHEVVYKYARLVHLPGKMMIKKLHAPTEGHGALVAVEGVAVNAEHGNRAAGRFNAPRQHRSPKAVDAASPELQALQLHAHT
jgi:hypothetical protein